MTRNISADILHDMYEGAMPFVLRLVMEFMIESKIVKKSELVQTVQFYDYGEMNRRNIPSIVSLSKSNLGQNGAQSRCLFLHFPFIFSILKNNEKLRSVWDSVEALARISQIVHSFDLCADDLSELSDAVTRLLTSIQVIFRVKLIPKLHNLVHYVRIIKTVGPIAHMNVQRFESKHKVFKQLVSRSPCFVNICKMLAVRHQQQISISEFGLEDKISYGTKRLLTSETCNADDELLNIFLVNRVVYETKYFCFNNFRYKKSNFIIESGTIFEISKILIVQGTFYLYCSVYDIVEFDSFYYAYKIRTKSPRQNKMLQFDDIAQKTPYEKKVVESDEFIIAATLDIRKCTE